MTNKLSQFLLPIAPGPASETMQDVKSTSDDVHMELEASTDPASVDVKPSLLTPVTVLRNLPQELKPLSAGLLQVCVFNIEML